MVRVLIEIESHEPLMESAARSMSVEKSAIPEPGIKATATDIGLSSDVILDTSFEAIAVGTGEPGADLASFEPGQSPKFVVRADVPESAAESGSVNGRRLFSDPGIAPIQICPGDPALGTDIDASVQHNIPAIHQRGLTGDRVAVAIMDTGISSQHLAGKNKTGVIETNVVWNALAAISGNGGLTPPGGHAVGHGTMCAFDVLIGSPDARLLDYPIMHGFAGQPAGSSIGGFLGDVLQAYAHLEAFWSVSFGGARQKYDALVISNSWGVFHPSWDFPDNHPGRYIDNPNHPFNLRVEAMVRQNIDIIFAAGNCGSNCPDSRCGGVVTDTITGANAHPDVLTLAGVDTSDLRVGYSSQGPAIPGMGQSDKPDVACATHFLGSEAFGTGQPDSGTSTSCPVAAGCVAALRTQLNQAMFPPARMFDEIRATARQPSGVAGWNADLGFGIVDIDQAAQSLGI
ncbi:MAG: S8 family serine peptidase [bacterium]|nr:S8 family serine peptidase [bacterium]